MITFGLNIMYYHDSSPSWVYVLDVPTGTEEEDDVSVQLYTFNNNNKSEADELDKFSTHRQSSDNCYNLYIS